MEYDSRKERYINPYTDFGFKKLFGEQLISFLNAMFEAAEIARFNPNELNQYEDSLKNFRDLYSVIATAEKKGHAEGLAEGITKGANQKAIEIAKEMLAAGMPIDVVSQLTKLCKEQLGNI